MRMHDKCIWSAGLFFILLFLPASAVGDTLESRYATITYDSIRDLRRFNNELYMGSLKSQVKRSDTVEEEVVAKINFIVEKAMLVLDMFPARLEFAIDIKPDVAAVKNEFKKLYKINVDYIAFYSPRENTIFFAAREGELKVVAHEIGHVIVENYFKISPPQRIHEVLAQYAEKHITD